MKKRLSTFYLKKYFSLEIICLLLIGAAVYSGTLDHSFHADDKENILNNSSIHISNLSVIELTKAVTQSTISHTRPVALTSFALNYYFNGLDVTGYHIVNIIIHLLAGIVLYYFVKITLSIRLARDKFDETWFIPFFTALIWLVHPLHTQSVTYIVQRMNSMAAMFYILAMLLYVKGRLAPDKVNKSLFFSISFLAGLLALGSKQNAATLPMFILLYEWYFLQNLRLKFSWKKVVWIAAVGCLFAFLFYFYFGSSPLSKLLFPDYGSYPFTMAQRLLTQPRVVLHYISLIFYPAPSRLNLDYDFPLSYSLFSPPITIIAILGIVVMLGLAIFFAKKNRLYSFCILWFMGNLVIESSTILLEIIYEHRTYLPSMMLIFLTVLLLHQAIKERRALIVSLMVVTLLFSYSTYTRNKTYQNVLTLWTDIYNKSPNKARVNRYFGFHLNMAGRVDEAIPILENALHFYEKEIKSQQVVDSRKTAFYLRNLGVAYKNNGDYKKAIVYLSRALKEFSFDAETHFELGDSYYKTWRFDEAIYHFTKALEFSKHHKTDIVIQKNMITIRQSLDYAKRMLKAQKERK